MEHRNDGEARFAEARPDPEDMLTRVRRGVERDITEVTPWFLANMPAYYFRTHTPEEVGRHLRALISGQVLNEGRTVVLRSPCHTQITAIAPDQDGAALPAMLERNVQADIETARFYATRDARLRIDTVLLALQERANPRSPVFRRATEAMAERLARSAAEPGQPDALSADAFRQFLADASQDYVERFETDRALRHFQLSRELLSREDVLIRLYPLPGDGETRIMLGMQDPPRRGLLLQIARILRRAGLCIRRGYADSFRPAASSGRPEYAIVSFYVSDAGQAMGEEHPGWPALHSELSLLKCLFPLHPLDALADAGFSLRRVVLLQAAAELCHQCLLKENPWAFSLENIHRAMLANPVLSRLCADFFEARFAPARIDREPVMREIADDLRYRMSQLDSEATRQVFDCVLRLFEQTLRTNYYVENILGLGFRLDPRALAGLTGEAEIPYGVFFVHSPHGRGFHVRYREMARGGVRLVPTRTPEQFGREAGRLLDEVVRLALAQQIKNKDIPEGGAKAVLLLRPDAGHDAALKALVDTLLDLILPGATTPSLPELVDYLNRPEILYLGPDEHITPGQIAWTVARAQQRGYAWPAAFMSSKPRAGINHKEFGVTSLGVIVFAERVLRCLGIDPNREPFRVKMTGGPKGDVAGNAILRLIRQYGANARIVAISDGHGAASDPQGLAHEELLRLVRKGLSIVEFNPAFFSGPGACLFSAASPEGAHVRNTLHNTAMAELFIPAGGRPDTINSRNWRDFFTASGQPTARAIVEGANLFIAADARRQLEEQGVLVVHGSSANKTGVICSSYEVLAGLVLCDEEFMAIKGRYVRDVLDILHNRAAAEAELMLREYRASGGARYLTQITLELSDEINAAKDALYATLSAEAPDIPADPALCELLLRYCPPVLVEHYRERILQQTPRQHQYAMLAAYLASRIVYAEGVGWLKRVTQLRGVEDVVRAYLRQEKRLAAYTAELRRSRLPDRVEMARILENAGRKFLTKEDLGLK